MTSAHLQRAWLLVEQRRHQEALDELAQELALDPDNGIAHALRALCLGSLEKYREASGAAQAALEADPNHPLT